MGAKWNLATHARSAPLRRRQHHWSTQRRRDAPTTHQGAQLMLAECFFSAFQLRRRPETRAARPHAPERRVSCYPCRMRLLRAFRARLLAASIPSRVAVPSACIRASALVVGLSVPESPGCSISARRVTTISWPTGPPKPPMPPPARRPQQLPRRRLRHARHPRPSPRRRWLASRHRQCRRPTTAATARRQRRRRRPS